MEKLYACIVSDENKSDLLAVAEQFAYNAELLEDAVLFDVGGTENLFGNFTEIARKIYKELCDKKLSGSLAVAPNAASALLLARNRPGLTVVHDGSLQKIPLSGLNIDPDALDVLYALGLKTVGDLNDVPENDLISRFGLEFREALDQAKDMGNYVLTPNLKEKKVTWRSELDFAVADFEQLVFILADGLKKILGQTTYAGFSTERIDIIFGLENKTSKSYEIKLSFPSVDKTFWLKLVNLRIAGDPPETGIVSIDLVSYFTHPRSAQTGLFFSTKPEPESLLLTVNKIKKLVGEENVGVPVLLDQRLPKAFALDPEKLPTGKEALNPKKPELVLALRYFNPPLKADVVIHKKRLLYISTKKFKGKVKEYGGAWKGSSQWWKSFWRTIEWDVEMENQSVYRLQKDGDEWFIVGVYD